MTISLGAVSLDCADPAVLAAFWRDLLGGEDLFAGPGSVGIRVGGTVLVRDGDDGSPRQQRRPNRDTAGDDTCEVGEAASTVDGGCCSTRPATRSASRR